MNDLSMHRASPLVMCIVTDVCRRIVPVVVITLFALVASGQQTFVSRSLTVNDGLPQGFVSGIVQDDDGFIWLATRDGLARYDGSEFKVFYTNDRRTTNISSNIITSLHHDHRNRIWILHESKAIDIFYPREERFETFTGNPAYQQLFRRFSPNFIRVDAHEHVWLIDPGNGLWKVDLPEHRVTHLSRKDNGLLCDTLRGIIETTDKHWWIFMQKGIQLIDDSNKIVETIHFDFPASNDIHINRNFAAGFAYADDHTIIIREMGKAFAFNTQTHLVRAIGTDQHRAAKHSGITSPQKDASGRLYFELMEGLYQYDTLSGKATRIWDGKLQLAHSFFIDRSDVAWFGNSANGLQVLNLTSLPFKSHVYTSGFFADVLGQLDVPFGKIPWMHHTPPNQYAYDVSTRYDYDSKGNLWMTFGDNAAIVDAKAKTFKALEPLHGKDPAFYYTPMSVSDDTCWRVYSLTGTPVYFDNRSAKWIYPFGETWKLSLPTNILDIVKIENTIWAATKHDGLLAIDLSTKQTHWYKREQTAGAWPTDELTDIERDPANDSILWIGTRAGLVRFNMQTKRSQTFSVKTGLPNNTIYCIVTDRNRLLWLSTNKGLCRFDPINFTVQNFSGSDGLQGDEFNSFHGFIFPDGRIAFGGTAGLTTLDPLLIREDAFQPPVQLTKVKVNNEEVDATANSSMFNDLLKEPSILNLDYNQNFLSFSFAGLQFNNVGRIHYRYRLTGLDKDWNYSGRLGMANYTNVLPGEYILELNASNTSGVWSKNIKRVLITISPPLWQTPVAYVIYAFLFAGGVILYIRYTTRKIRLEDLVALKNKEAEQLKQLDEVKSRFFANMTHEFRTPLTLIVSPLEELLRHDDFKPSHKKQLTIIQQSARQLLQLINELLDLSKLDAGLTQTTLAPVNLENFLEAIVARFQPMAASAKLTLHFESELGLASYLADQDKLERIVNNLLSNAIKFTPTGGRVSLHVSTVENTADRILLRVIDTGVGIAPDALPKVFDRFYQADDKPMREYEGTGIGLALVKELTGLLNGTVTVESVAGKGTVFAVMLPLAKSGSNVRVGEEVVDMKTSDNDTDESILQDESKPLILVVEDNDSLRSFLSDQLAPDYTVVTAVNGRDAWETILKTIPSLVITDVMMPYLDGIALSKKIRETEETSHIGLILLTARTSAESRTEGLQTGANDYIAKPFHFGELQLRIANLLAYQQKQREYFHRKLVVDEKPPVADEVENKFLKTAYAFIDDALAGNKTIGVEDLASHFSMSSRNLSRKLQALVGLPTGEFIRSYRLKRATKLLKEGYAVAEVAYQVGFESSQYFAQCFKAQYKVTPSEYMNGQMIVLEPNKKITAPSTHV